MRVVYKYPLKGDYTTVQVPQGSKPLHVGKDPMGNICVWIERAVVYEKLSNEQFMVVGTGIEFEDKDSGWKHFQSFIDGPFMWHIYRFSR